MMASLRLRLAIGAFIAIGLATLMMWFSLSRMFTDYVVDRYAREMGTISDTLAAGLTVEQVKLVLGSAPGDPRFDLPAGGRYWQISAAGQAPIRSRSLWDVSIEPKDFAAETYYGFSSTEGPDGAEMLVFARTLSLGEGATAIAFTAYTAFPRAELDEALDGYHGQLRLMLLVVAIILAGSAFLQGAIGLSPLVRLRRRVADVRAGRETDLGSAGPSEVRPLTSELNLLLQERATAVERARARASDLAHGLKTPLTVLSNLADHLPEKQRSTALEQVDLIRQRADRQLQAARMGVEQMTMTTLANLAEKLVNVLQPVTRPRGIRWTVKIDPALVIGIDPADLAEALGNLLDNAAKWARSRISVTAAVEDGKIRIVVDDDGPGIARDAHAEVLRRGGRLGSEVSGSGLGLAITLDIAQAYGGRLELGQSALGGLKVTLIFAKTAR
ncbi:sensor histidine kinase [Pararhizobium sp.]|uniref:sensor histidine kinase n=1 Tax=Pararhizobium sp. TaxID=1977563 RepID=UPI00271A72D7|nr:sensor histidine kinase [Pararhizobium sp.]MDO9416428.1 sensor histidine kinase [Pararhizobium sp.]